MLSCSHWGMFSEEMVTIKRDIADYIGCLNEQIMPATASRAAGWIMERVFGDD